MANKIKRADAVLWLAEMKEEGSTHLRTLYKQYATQAIAEVTLRNAQQRQEVIIMLLKIFQACDMEPAELLEMLQGMKGQGRGQASLFRQPKNPM